MINTILEMFTYPFMVRAIIVGGLVSLCAALLGTSLVLKRYSMIGDGLSHVGFAALAVAYAVNAAPLVVAVPVCVIAAFLLLRMNENSKIKGDAATALMCSGALAVGVMTVSLTTGMNTDVCNYMFGSILAMSKVDVKISLILSIVVIILFVVFYEKIFAVTFDESFAKATGTKSNLYNMIIAVLTAITVVLGMRIMGTLLISSLIVFPSLSAMRVCKNYKSVIILSVIISLFCFFAGIYVSYKYSTPTGASIVIANIVVFAIMWLIEAIKVKKNVVVVSMLLMLLLVQGCNQNTTTEENSNPVLENTTENASLEEITTQSQAGENNQNAITKESSLYYGDFEADRAAFSGTADIVVGDNLYSTQINDWYMNFDQYEGKTVEIEGYYIGDYSPYDFVGRYGPSCPYCQGGYVCFEIFSDEDMSAYASGEDWIKVVGILKAGDDQINGEFYYIEALKIEKMEQPGLETVSN